MVGSLPSLKHRVVKPVSSLPPRVCWLLPASLQHHAVHLLQHQRGLLLRQPQRQVLLALHHRPPPHDAREQLPDPPVHQPVLSVRSSFPSRGCPQPGHHHSTVPGRLAQPVDWILLPHGKKALGMPQRRAKAWHRLI